METYEAKFILNCMDHMKKHRDNLVIYEIWEKSLRDEIIDQIKKVGKSIENLPTNA